MIPIPIRLARYTDKNGPVPDYAPDLGNCWLWTGALSKEGYGKFCIDRKNRGAHVVAYEQVNGPVPDGLELDHLCRVRHCVRPSHLEAVTPQINQRRGNGFSGVNARKTHCPQGHPYAGENVFVSNGKRICRICNRAKSMRSYYKRRGRAAA